MSYEPPAPHAHAEVRTADVVAAEWRRRTQSEYTSAAIAHQVTLWLIQVGGPPDLIRDGLRIVEDELTHSELSAHVMAATGGTFVPPVIGGAMLTLPGGHDPRAALPSSILRFFCVGETVAVPLFRMLRERCSVPVARQALDRVMRDEARHRQFGWDVLDWLLLGDRDAVLRVVAREVPLVLDGVAAAYGMPVGEPPGPELLPEVAAWGLAARAEYAETLSVALRRDVLPRLAARGVVTTAGPATPIDAESKSPGLTRPPPPSGGVDFTLHRGSGNGASPALRSSLTGRIEEAPRVLLHSFSRKATPWAHPCR